MIKIGGFAKIFYTWFFSIEFEKNDKGVFLDTITELKSFFSRYQKFIKRNEKQRIKDFKRNFLHIKIGIQIIQNLNQEIYRVTSKNFNVFTLLGIGHYETSTHTAFLADLLNPNGTHSQGFLFLKSFFTELQTLKSCHKKNDFPIKPDGIDEETWFIDRERVTKFGNLDIAISCPTLKKMIVIENKIYAGEQDKQLYRYVEWIESKRIYYEEAAMIYLTLDGLPGTTALGKDYFILSYRKNISRWLKSVLERIPSYRLKETLIQYIELINYL